MDTKSMNDFDNFMDEANEFDLLFGCIHNFGLDTENELKFNGDAELARIYQQKSDDVLSDFIDIYSQPDVINNNDKNSDSTGFSTIETKPSEDTIQIVSNNAGTKTIHNNVLDTVFKTENNKNNNITRGSSGSVMGTASKTSKTFSLALYTMPKQSSTITTFQETNESRVKY